MRNLVGSLGKYQSNLRACWGFDCLYGANAKPDDATFWYQWLSDQTPRHSKSSTVHRPFRNP